MQENKHTIKAKLISANKNFLKSICIIFSVFTVIWAFLHFFMGFGTWQGKSYETYKEHVNCGLRYHEELPKGEKGKYYKMVRSENNTWQFDSEGYNAMLNRMKNGFRLFGKYYMGLWD